MGVWIRVRFDEMLLSLGDVSCFKIMSKKDGTLLQMATVLGNCSLQNDTFQCVS